MAKPYPIVPLSFLDELNDLNGQLDAYHQLLMAYVRCQMDDTSTPGAGMFIAGLEDLFRPILEGFQGIESQCSTARQMGMVGIASLDPDQAVSD